MKGSTILSPGTIAPAAPPPAHQGGICLEIGGIRITVETVSEARELLAPLLRTASRKEIADMLGVSPRTLYRWRREGKLGRGNLPNIAQVLRNLATTPGSGAAR